MTSHNFYRLASLIFCGCMLFIDGACKKPVPPPPDYSLDFSEQNVLPAKTVEKSTWRSRLKALNLEKRVRKPYSLLCYYSFVDTLESNTLEKYFHTKFIDTLESRLPNLVTPILRSNIQRTEELMRANRPQDLSPSFLQAARRYEWAVGVFASHAQRTVEIRYLHLETGRMSPIITQSFVFPTQVAAKVQSVLPSIMGIEGYIVKIADKKVTAVLRGDSRELVRMGGVAEGKYFWVFKGNKRVRDCMVRLNENFVSGDYLLASGRYIGQGAPFPGLRIIQAYLAKGSQTFRVVNERGQPASGFSVFHSYRGFSTEHRYYLDTTDSSGEFTLSNPESKPIFLVITRNVEEVNLTFARKLVVLEPEKGVVEITVRDLPKDADITAEELTAQDIADIEKLAHDYLEQAREHVKRQELGKAIVAIRMAGRNLKRIDDVSDQEELRMQIEKIEGKYRILEQEKLAAENYGEALKYLQKMDEAITALDYARAQKMSIRVDKTWPEKQFAKQRQQVEKRKQRLAVLLKERSEPLGLARFFLARKLASIKPEQIDSAKLDEIQTHVHNLFTRGENNPGQIYNDLDLCAQTRLTLDKLSKDLAEKSRYYEQQYHEENATEKRREIFETYENYLRYYQRIDKWLKDYKKSGSR